MGKKSYKKLLNTSMVFASVNKHKPTFANYLQEIGFSSFSNSPTELWSNIYTYMFHNYRYEYIYKNELLRMFYPAIKQGNKKLLSEVELWMGNTVHNILDILLISSEDMHAIEIKSDFDTFQRLDNQLPMYCKLFNFVSVFISKHKLDYLTRYIDNIGFSHVGILTLDDTKIETVRAPRSNLDRLDAQLLLDNLHQPNLHQNLDVQVLYSMWFDKLSANYSIDSNFIEGVPPALKFYAFSHSFLSPLNKHRLVKQFK